jgi:16S rRNA (guanine527-N7)-methyltransferase
MDIILKYFPHLSDLQQQQFQQLLPLYTDWNEKINVISRKDMEFFYEKHVLHSLGIAKIISFKPGTAILDIGTGGGFPGIPLAILFPETQFHLVDSIGKKITVVQDVAQQLGLKNVKAEQIRAELISDKFDFVVSRAVTRFINFVPWMKGKFKKESFNEFPNGLLLLKGGDVDEEMEETLYPYVTYHLSDYFQTEFFETKKVIHVPWTDKK